MEKERRKVEGELKMTQEAVADIGKTRTELEVAIMDEEQSRVGKVQKSIKEFQGRIEEMEEETAKAEVLPPILSPKLDSSSCFNLEIQCHSAVKHDQR